MLCQFFLDSAYVGRSRSPHARRSHSKADPLWTAFIRQTPTMRTSQAIQGYCQGQFEEVRHTPTVTHQCPTRSRTVAFDVSDSHHRFWGSTGWQSTEETGSPQAPGRQQHQHGHGRVIGATMSAHPELGSLPIVVPIDEAVRRTRRCSPCMCR